MPTRIALLALLLACPALARLSVNSVSVSATVVRSAGLRSQPAGQAPGASVPLRVGWLGTARAARRATVELRSASPAASVYLVAPGGDVQLVPGQKLALPEGAGFALRGGGTADVVVTIQADAVR